MKSKDLKEGTVLSIQFYDKEDNPVVEACATIISKRRISYNKATEELVEKLSLSPKKQFGFVMLEKGKWIAREL